MPPLGVSAAAWSVVLNAADLPQGAAGTVRPDAAGQFMGMAGNFTLGVVIFLAIIYVVYLVYKYVLSGTPGKLNFGLSKNKHMRVLEITPVGPGSTVQLVKVSEEYFLIGVTRNQISFLTKTDCPSSASETGDEGRTPVFERYFGNLLKKNAGAKDKAGTERLENQTDLLKEDEHDGEQGDRS